MLKSRLNLYICLTLLQLKKANNSVFLFTCFTFLNWLLRTPGFANLLFFSLGQFFLLMRPLIAVCCPLPAELVKKMRAVQLNQSCCFLPTYSLLRCDSYSAGKALIFWDCCTISLVAELQQGCVSYPKRTVVLPIHNLMVWCRQLHCSALRLKKCKPQGPKSRNCFCSAAAAGIVIKYSLVAGRLTKVQ